MSGPERLVLFRFHHAFDVCRNRLEHLRRCNPGVRVFGLYGGPPSTFREARRALEDHLEDVWEIPETSGVWKWRHGDLSLRGWYRSVGKDLLFDLLHLVEWDLLVLGDLDEVYGQAGRNGVAMVGVTPLSKIQREWYWTCTEPYAGEWEQLRKLVRERHGWDGPHLASQGPASAFSRAFLERYSLEDVPELTHEELRLPLYAQALGFEVTPLPHIYGELWNGAEMEFFNCEGEAISERTIRREVARPDGRRVFHPCLKPFHLVPERRWWWPF